MKRRFFGRSSSSRDRKTRSREVSRRGSPPATLSRGRGFSHRPAMNPKISAAHLKRRAVVYIRQSSPGQVVHNQESQRRQYGLADHARQLGFHQVEVIDEDLGRSGSGQVERPGFEHLVAEVCTGEVGAVLCIEASRLARTRSRRVDMLSNCPPCTLPPRRLVQCLASHPGRWPRTELLRQKRTKGKMPATIQNPIKMGLKTGFLTAAHPKNASATIRRQIYASKYHDLFCFHWFLLVRRGSGQPICCF